MNDDCGELVVIIVKSLALGARYLVVCELITKVDQADCRGVEPAVLIEVDGQPRHFLRVVKLSLISHDDHI